VPLTSSLSRRLHGSYLEEVELFDRGFFAGPFGWVSGQGAEFVVAIRSALVQPLATLPGNGITSEATQQLAAAVTPQQLAAQDMLHQVTCQAGCC